MKIYIQQVDGVWSHSQHREDFESLSKEEYNMLGWYDLEPTPSPPVDINAFTTKEIYLDAENIARYRWSVTQRTGDDLARATSEKWHMVRTARTEMLSNTDFTQVADAPITTEKRAEWTTYRQALRDLTSQTDPFNITWPTSPDGRVTQIGIARA
jgi:hypothetical protein